MKPQQISVKDFGGNGKDDNVPRAIVLLLGWWGAEMRHVEKYAELYTTRNCATVSIIADTLQVMTHLAYPSLDPGARAAACEVANLLRKHEKNGKQIPVLIHTFSNAGTFLAERLEFLIQQAQKNVNVPCCKELVLVGERLDGEIFDSAPAYPDWKLGFTSTSGVVFGDSIIVKIIVGILFWLLGAISVCFNFFLGLPDVRWTFWENMREGRICTRQTYIYSTADSITDIKMLEELIENRKSFAKIRVQKFDDSKHVLHMLKHPKVYENLVDEFLQETRRQIETGRH